MKGRAKRITSGELSPEARRRYEEIQQNLGQILEDIEAERPAIEARAREVLARSAEPRESVKRAMAVLKAECESQGVSLDELADRTLASVDELRELEEGRLHHFDVSLVIRYADALGKQAVLQIAEK